MNLTPPPPSLLLLIIIIMDTGRVHLVMCLRTPHLSPVPNSTAWRQRHDKSSPPPPQLYTLYAMLYPQNGHINILRGQGVD